MKLNKSLLKHTNFILESGESLKTLEIAYHSFGTLNKDSKIVWVCHALTANSNFTEWWPGVFSENSLFNKDEYFVICANSLGSCYGTTGPLNSEVEKSFLKFPQFSTRDMVKVYEILAKELKISKIDLIIGASIGGQQALEFAFSLGPKLEKLVLIATNVKHSPFGIAFNESQRLAISADETFFQQKIDGGQKGLVAARSIALLSYRSYSGYEKTQQENSNELTDNFKASSYQNYQGNKLAKRFNAYSYFFLSKAMDSHNVGRNRKSLELALSKIKAKTAVIGITSDILFPIVEQQYLARNIPDAKFFSITSNFGHDGFLIETKKINRILKNFINK